MSSSSNIIQKEKFLIFSLGEENFGIKIDAVREIIRYDSLTPVHDSQEYIMGVINLRGKIIPVMDLRKKFGLSFKEYNDKTVLIILQIQGKQRDYQIALSVDAVHEVVSPKKDDIEKAPELGLSTKKKYLLGILKQQDRMVMILDINRIVTNEEIINIKSAVENDTSISS